MFYYLHIPRTAGRTFSLVAPQVLDLAPCRYSECCRAQLEVVNFVSRLDGQQCNFVPYMGNYDLIYSFRRAPVVLTLLRNPAAWLLASVAKDLTSGTQITMQDLTTLERECKSNKDHPACVHRAYPPKRSVMTERLASGDLDLAKARLTAPEMAFFGLMEYFIESQCLLLYQFGLLTGDAATKCSCQEIAQLRQARAGQPVVSSDLHGSATQYTALLDPTTACGWRFWNLSHELPSCLRSRGPPTGKGELERHANFPWLFD